MAICVSLGAVASYSAQSQEAPNPSAAEVAVTPIADRPAAQPLLPKNTEVVLAVDAALGSRSSKIGDLFRIKLASPVMDAAGKILLRVGIVGEGEVIHAAKSGFGGKGGELILAARFLQCGDERVPLGRFHLGGAGKDTSKTTVVASAAIGAVSPIATLPLMFVTGGEYNVPAGTLAQARISADTSLTEADAMACGEEKKGEGK